MDYPSSQSSSIFTTQSNFFTSPLHFTPQPKYAPREKTCTTGLLACLLACWAMFTDNQRSSAFFDLPTQAEHQPKCVFHRRRRSSAIAMIEAAPTPAEKRSEAAALGEAQNSPGLGSGNAVNIPPCSHQCLRQLGRLDGWIQPCQRKLLREPLKHPSISLCLLYKMVDTKATVHINRYNLI